MNHLTYSNKFLKFIKSVGDVYDDKLFIAAHSLGITKQEADVLLFLTNNPNYTTASEIARLRGFSRAYVSKAVDKLLDREFLIVKVKEQDHRVQNLELSAKGVEMSDHLKSAQKKILALITRGVSKEEYKTCMTVMEKMLANAESIETLTE